jgi:hypothetical protein
MASTYVNDLRLNEMATGDQSGSWGTVTNTNLELIGEAFSYGTEAITTNADTHATTIADGASDAGRAMFLKYTGTLDSTCTITIGPNTVSKMWFIENATTGSQDIIISQGSGANVTIAAGQTKAVYSDGAGSGAAFVDAFAALDVGSLAIAGTLVTSTAAELNILDGVTATAAEINILDGVTATTAEINILDGVTATAAEINILDGVTATAAEINILDGVTATAAEINILDGVTATTAEINYVDGVTSNIQTQLDATAKLTVAQSFTAKQTFAGSASVASMKTSNIAEVDTIAATAATGTIDYDVTTQSVLFYTTDASGNWTLNLRGSSGTSLDTLMATGESLSVTFLVTQGATAYYNSAVTIDGSSVTPKWQGGTAPTIGNASSVDCYTYVIQKTGAATYVVLASQTQFA